MKSSVSSNMSLPAAPPWQASYVALHVAIFMEATSLAPPSHCHADVPSCTTECPTTIGTTDCPWLAWVFILLP